MQRVMLRSEMDEIETDESIMKRAFERIRACGDDPDALMATALRNLNAWRALSHEERLAISREMDDGND